MWWSRFRHSRREHTQINRGQTEAKVAAWAGAKERAGGDLDANAWEGEKEEPAVEGERAAALPDRFKKIKNGLREYRAVLTLPNAI